MDTLIGSRSRFVCAGIQRVYRWRKHLEIWGSWAVLSIYTSTMNGRCCDYVVDPTKWYTCKVLRICILSTLHAYHFVSKASPEDYYPLKSLREIVRAYISYIVQAVSYKYFFILNKESKDISIWGNIAYILHGTIYFIFAYYMLTVQSNFRNLLSVSHMLPSFLRSVYEEPPSLRVPTLYVYRQGSWLLS